MCSLTFAGASFKLICMLVSQASLHAGTPLRYGLQIGLTMPTGDDLRTTTRSGLNPSFGLHATWRIDDDQSLRLRLDLWAFGAGHQEVSAPLTQRINTQVRIGALASFSLRPLWFIFSPG